MTTLGIILEASKDSGSAVAGEQREDGATDPMISFRPRDPDEFEDMDVVQLGAQLDVLQTLLIAVITGLGGKSLGKSLVKFVDRDLEVTASVGRSEGSTDESLAESQALANRYLQGVAKTKERIRRAIASIEDD